MRNFKISRSLKRVHNSFTYSRSCFSIGPPLSGRLHGLHFSRKHSFHPFLPRELSTILNKQRWGGGGGRKRRKINIIVNYVMDFSFFHQGLLLDKICKGGIPEAVTRKC